MHIWAAPPGTKVGISELDVGLNLDSSLLTLAEFVATIFATNDSILGGDLSEINRDK